MTRSHVKTDEVIVGHSQLVASGARAEGWRRRVKAGPYPNREVAA